MLFQFLKSKMVDTPPLLDLNVQKTLATRMLLGWSPLVISVYKKLNPCNPHLWSHAFISFPPSDTVEKYVLCLSLKCQPSSRAILSRGPDAKVLLAWAPRTPRARRRLTLQTSCTSDCYLFSCSTLSSERNFWLLYKLGAHATRAVRFFGLFLNPYKNFTVTF